MVIDPETLKWMAYVVFNYDKETCAPGFVVNDVLYLDVNNFVVGDEKSCLTRERAYIYHSHPSKSKAYPSIQDMEKFAKHDYILCQIIATKWGLWIMRKEERGYHLQDENLKRWSVRVAEGLDTIYRNTERGRGEYGRNVIRATEEFASNFERISDQKMHIKLVGW